MRPTPTGGSRKRRPAARRGSKRSHDAANARALRAPRHSRRVSEKAGTHLRGHGRGMRVQDGAVQSHRGLDAHVELRRAPGGARCRVDLLPRPGQRRRELAVRLRDRSVCRAQGQGRLLVRSLHQPRPGPGAGRRMPANTANQVLQGAFVLQLPRACGVHRDGDRGSALRTHRRRDDGVPRAGAGSFPVLRHAQVAQALAWPTACAFAAHVAALRSSRARAASATSWRA